MKKIFLFCFLSTYTLSLSAQNVKKIIVKSEIKGCWAAIISEEEANASGNEYGWWSAWHKIKEAKKYKTTPAVFTNIPKGKYIIVIYNPASKQFDPNAGIPGQSSDGVVLEEVDIQGDKTFSVGKGDFKDWNCLSCPWLYLWNGSEYVRLSEVIKDQVGKKSEQRSLTEIPVDFIRNGSLKIRIQEEKEEISYLNRIVLRVGDQVVLSSDQKNLEEPDAEYIMLKKGEGVNLEFNIDPTTITSQKIVLDVQGYYEPEKSFLSAVYQKYLKTK